MAKIFICFCAYLLVFGFFTGTLFSADITLYVVGVTSMLTCAVTFSYTFYLHGKISRRPRLYLLFFLLLLMSVQVGSERWLFVVFGNSIDRRAEKIRASAREKNNLHDHERYSQALLDLAERGDVGAERRVGWCYLDGYGVIKDAAVAAKWYRLAAEHGDLHSQFRLGWFYDHGLGVPTDALESEKWLLKAAERGDVWAQAYLGLCYTRGFCENTDTRDVFAATLWLERAAGNGVWEAKELDAMIAQRERIGRRKWWMLALSLCGVVLGVVVEWRKRLFSKQV